MNISFDEIILKDRIKYYEDFIYSEIRCIYMDFNDIKFIEFPEIYKALQEIKRSKIALGINCSSSFYNQRKLSTSVIYLPFF